MGYKCGNPHQLLFLSAKNQAKHRDLGLHWIHNLTGGPQVVRAGNTTSSPISLSTGAPQGSVLRPFLYSRYTSDYVVASSYNSLINFVNDTVAVGVINSDKKPYLHEVENLTAWRQANKSL